MITTSLKIGKLFDIIAAYEKLHFLPEIEQFLATPINIQDQHGNWVPVCGAVTKKDQGVKLTFNNGDIIKCANNHKIIKDGVSSQVFAKDLHVHDSVTKADGTTIYVKSMESINDEIFYDLCVDTVDHLYQTSNGIVHHNTELARLLAHELGYALVRLDMSEFQEKHSLARLIGSPPGYVGYSDGSAGSGVLINALEQSPQCVLLIDEVEKAHPEVINIFLQAMDHGVITSSNQKNVSLKNVLLVFTSNLGAAAMEKPPLGFTRTHREGEDTAAIQQFFAPEFRNRLDAVISFDKLEKPVMSQILDKFLDQLNVLCKPKNITVVVDPDAREWLLTHGFDTQMGARPLNRCIDTHIKRAMSKEMLFGKLMQGGRVLVTVDTVLNKLKLDFLALNTHTPITNSVLQDALWDMEVGR